MITFSKLGNKGNLGNQLFQVAATIGIASKNGHDFSFPSWQADSFFQKKLPTVPEGIVFEPIKITDYHYNDIRLGSGNYDLDGWLQSEKYFDINKVRDYLAFEETFHTAISKKYQHLFAGKTILISVRRGDFVHHPHYFQLSFKYYFSAMLQHFPDWQNRNLIFTSDDINYCKYHFAFLKNAFFCENLTAYEQLALGSMCDDFIISNSTFSWWMAWLGEKSGTKIIRPVKNFSNNFALKNDEKDYFPERWMPFDDRLHRISPKYFSLIIKGFLYQSVSNLRWAFVSSINRLKKMTKKIFS